MTPPTVPSPMESADAYGPGPATLGVGDRWGFGLTVPPSWYEIDVHPASRERSIRELVESRVRGNDAMWEQRNGIIKLLVEHATNAWQAGATYCASFATPTDEGPVTGSVVVSLVRGPAGASEEADRTEHLASLYRSVPRGPEEFSPYTSVGTVEIPTCGTCARSWGIADIDIGEGPARRTVRTVFLQTAVPVPDRTKVFLISASSPVVALEESLLDLFDAVTGTFRMLPLAEIESS